MSLIQQIRWTGAEMLAPQVVPVELQKNAYAYNKIKGYGQHWKNQTKMFSFVYITVQFFCNLFS